ASQPQPEAFPILSLMVALAMSTYAQCLFGQDHATASATRYRLLPLRGCEVLLAKDIAFLGVVLVIVLPLDPLPGLAFSMFALAVGHHTSVFQRIALRRWRFAGGRVFAGVVQSAGGFMLGIAVHRISAAFFLVAVAIYLASVAAYGRAWEARG